MKTLGGNFQPFGPQPNPIFGPPPNPPPPHNPPRTPQRSSQGSSDTQSTHLNRHDTPSRRANSLYQEDNIRGRVDDWDDGVVNEGDQHYQGGWDNNNPDAGYGYHGHQQYAYHNQGYQGRHGVPRMPDVNQYPDGGYDHFHDGVPRAPNRGLVQVRKRENGDERIKPIETGLLGSPRAHRGTRWPNKRPIRDTRPTSQGFDLQNPPRRSKGLLHIISALLELPEVVSMARTLSRHSHTHMQCLKPTCKHTPYTCTSFASGFDSLNVFLDDL
ncbi:hypothetical protein E3N88_27081 [Mikania micrantha]|uniref:Uncharacterized protein n=1 Tax=Mikania micrantha TaxID=192012 RepID=A0A5N6MWU5_9ASTR|nr:hypothetical protein E3N88_27081 [Mikania micrantha]